MKEEWLFPEAVMMDQTGRDAWVENRQNNKGMAFYIKEKK